MQCEMDPTLGRCIALTSVWNVDMAVFSIKELTASPVGIEREEFPLVKKGVRAILPCIDAWLYLTVAEFLPQETQHLFCILFLEFVAIGLA